MKTILRNTLSTLAAVVLAASPLLAGAQSRAAVVAAPAKVAVSVDGVSVVPAGSAACTPAPGYPCGDPAPLPPGAGNSCFRGNSAGVSRCPR